MYLLNVSSLLIKLLNIRPYVFIRIIRISFFSLIHFFDMLGFDMLQVVAAQSSLWPTLATLINPRTSHAKLAARLGLPLHLWEQREYWRPRGVHNCSENKFLQGQENLILGFLALLKFGVNLWEEHASGGKC